MQSSKTSIEYDKVIEICKKIFEPKMTDYGTSWRIMRTSTINDQIYIKANRIRTIEEKGEAKVNEGIIPEFIGIVNYAIMGLIQLELGPGSSTVEEQPKIKELYSKYFAEAKTLMMNKNHDYDEAWREMRVSSFTDIILVRIYRMKHIEDNQGCTLVSEGLDANFFDIINYAVFALIRLVVEV